MPAQRGPLNIEAVHPKAAMRLIRSAVRVKQPVFIHGRPGIGKSQIVRQVAAREGLHVIDLRASLLDAVDLRGVPAVTVGPDGRRQTEWVPPVFLPRDGCGILFLDELNRAPASVQNALLQLCLDRRIGEYELPEGWTVVAAGNYESDGGGVSRTNSALSFRFKHVYLEPDVLEWCEWAARNGIEPVMIAFHRYRHQNQANGLPNVFDMFDRNADASPNPRSWEFVNREMVAGVEPEDEVATVAGYVGKPAAVEYLAYRRLFKNLPNIDAIIMNPDTAAVPAQIDVMYAVSAALAARAAPSNFGRILTYLKRLPREFQVFSVRDALARDKDAELPNCIEFTMWAVDNQDALS
jgi:hypothetical protein